MKNSKYIVNKGFIVQRMGESIKIFDAEKSTLFSFNRIATMIFDKLNQEWDEKRIVSFLVKEYNIDSKRALDDYREYIDELLKNKIISQRKVGAKS